MARRFVKSVIATMVALATAGCAALLGLDDVSYDGPGQSDAGGSDRFGPADVDAGPIRREAGTAICADAGPVLFCDDFDNEDAGLNARWDGTDIQGGATIDKTDTLPHLSPPRSLRARTADGIAQSARVYKVFSQLATMRIDMGLLVAGSAAGGNALTRVLDLVFDDGARLSVSVFREAQAPERYALYMASSAMSGQNVHTLAEPSVSPKNGEWFHVTLSLDLRARVMSVTQDKFQLLTDAPIDLPNKLLPESYRQVTLFVGSKVFGQPDAGVPEFDIVIDDFFLDGT